MHPASLVQCGKLNLHNAFMNETAVETGPTVSATESANPQLSQPSLATLEAGREALGTEVLNPLNSRGKPRGKPGRPITHGKYAAKRKIPVASVDSGTVPLLVEDTFEAAVGAIPVESQHAPFDREAAEPYAEIVLDLLNELHAEYRYWRVYRKTKDKEVSQLISENQQMTDSPRKMMKEGMLGMAEKYNVDLTKSPEAAFFGGLLVWQMRAERSMKEGIEQMIKARAMARGQ